MRRVMEDRPLDMDCMLLIQIHFRLRPDDFRELPITDPYDGWWGGGAVKRRPLPDWGVIFYDAHNTFQLAGVVIAFHLPLLHVYHSIKLHLRISQGFRERSNLSA
jgi:hypothetical protein